VTPWSIGMMTALPVLRLIILSMRIDVPLNFSTPIVIHLFLQFFFNFFVIIMQYSLLMH
jgi:hypothetical protein